MVDKVWFTALHADADADGLLKWQTSSDSERRDLKAARLISAFLGSSIEKTSGCQLVYTYKSACAYLPVYNSPSSPVLISMA